MIARKTLPWLAATVAFALALMIATAAAGEAPEAPAAETAPAADEATGAAPATQPDLATLAREHPPAPAPAAITAPAPVGPAITLITGDWVDVRTILSSLAEQAGLPLRIAPDVEGRVNVHLENVDLATALRSLLDPIDLGYELEGGVLTIYRQGLVTRWFHFDYMVAQREGRGELRISGRGQGGGASDTGSGGDEQNESQVTSSVRMAIWPEVAAALQTLVFGGATELIGHGGDTGGESGGVNVADQEGRSLVANAMAGVIQVTAEWKRVDRVASFLARLTESLRRQVAVEVKILEVTLDEGHRSGIDWNAINIVDGGKLEVGGALTSTEGLTSPFFQFVVNGKSVTSMLEAVETQGRVQVISEPKITTLNNQKAVVRLVTEEVFFEAQVEPPIVTNGVATEPVIAYIPRVIPVGLVLDVTPQVSGDGTVTLNVHPTLTDIVRVEESPNQDRSPVLRVRELDTVGKVTDGETLVIAGLMADGLRDTRQGVPLLKSIPILGYFFRRTVKEKTRTELVMLLTPVILDAERNAAWSEEAEKALRGKM
jgi:MSHA biogenesis protein MshL